MEKSWFYLTLWEGTPPEFTSELAPVIPMETRLSTEIHGAAPDAGTQTIEIAGTTEVIAYV